MRDQLTELREEALSYSRECRRTKDRSAAQLWALLADIIERILGAELC